MRWILWILMIGMVVKENDLIWFPDYPNVTYKVLATRARYGDLEVVQSNDANHPIGYTPIGYTTNNSDLTLAQLANFNL